MCRSKAELLAHSKEVMVGGVNSPVRAFHSVACEPVIATGGKGACLFDFDGTPYIDYVLSYGPLIFGHSPDFIVEEITKAAAKGTTFGFTCPQEVELADLILSAYPGAEMVRMVNSGTEATMSAIRVARAYTNRSKIVKFEGHYHGHNDGLLVKSGSGLLSHGVPTSKGLTPGVAEFTLVAPYNDFAALEKMFRENEGEIAAVIIEPVAGNMGVLPPAQGYLENVRALTKKNGALLIFDEVITGFRLDYHCAAGYFGIEPDMMTLGKIIGGGLPVGAYGGKREIMSLVSPLGPVYQGGTLSGNPLAMGAGIAALKKLRDQPQLYEVLANGAKYLEAAFDRLFETYGIAATTSRIEGMFCVFFTMEKVKSYEDVMAADTKAYQRFFEGMMKRGILLPPSQFEAWFLSTAHDEEVLTKTMAAAEEVLKEMRDER